MRVTVSLCPDSPDFPDFYREVVFRAPWTGLDKNLRTGAQHGAESALR
jgi:hypothetical protein